MGFDSLFLAIATIVSSAIPFILRIGRINKNIGLVEMLNKIELWSFILVVVFLLVFFGLVIFYRVSWKKIIKSYAKSDCKDIIKELSKSNNRDIMDVFLYTAWEYIQGNALLLKMYNNGCYFENKSVTNSDYIMLSFFKCFTYQSEEGKVFRSSTLLAKELEKREKIIEKYKEEFESNKDDKEAFFERLKDIEDCYAVERNNDKESKSVLPGKGKIHDIFCSFSNDEPSVNLMKIIFIVITIPLIFLDYFDIWVQEKTITFIFEIITVFLLFVDISKNKDKNILH